MTSVVVLSKEQTKVVMNPEDREKAISAAFRVTLSEHEHDWNLETQQLMAKYCLWATQRLDSINQISGGDDLNHESEDVSFSTGK